MSKEITSLALDEAIVFNWTDKTIELLKDITRKELKDYISVANSISDVDSDWIIKTTIKQEWCPYNIFPIYPYVTQPIYPNYPTYIVGYDSANTTIKDSDPITFTSKSSGNITKFWLELK